MFKKTTLFFMLIALTSFTQNTYCMNFFKSALHTTVAVACVSTLNEPEKRQLKEFVMPALEAHAFGAHIFEKNHQATTSALQSSHDLIALAPASLVAIKLFSKFSRSNMSAASLLACTFGALTWYASREWFKKAPQQAANVNPFVFVPRGALWIYEKVLLRSFQEQKISPNVLATASHAVQSNLLEITIPQFDIFLQQHGTKKVPMPARTKQFAQQLENLYRADE